MPLFSRSSRRTLKEMLPFQHVKLHPTPSPRLQTSSLTNVLSTPASAPTSVFSSICFWWAVLLSGQRRKWNEQSHMVGSCIWPGEFSLVITCFPSLWLSCNTLSLSRHERCNRQSVHDRTYLYISRDGNTDLTGCEWQRCISTFLQPKGCFTRLTRPGQVHLALKVPAQIFWIRSKK